MQRLRCLLRSEEEGLLCGMATSFARSCPAAAPPPRSRGANTFADHLATVPRRLGAAGRVVVDDKLDRGAAVAPEDRLWCLPIHSWMHEHVSFGCFNTHFNTRGRAPGRRWILHIFGRCAGRRRRSAAAPPPTRCMTAAALPRLVRRKPKELLE